MVTRFAWLKQPAKWVWFPENTRSDKNRCFECTASQFGQKRLPNACIYIVLHCKSKHHETNPSLQNRQARHPPDQLLRVCVWGGSPVCVDGVAMETDVGDSWSVPSWKRNVTPTRVCERWREWACWCFNVRERFNKRVTVARLCVRVKRSLSTAYQKLTKHSKMTPGANWTN